MQYSPLYGTERVTRLVLRASDYRVQRPFYPYKDELQRQCGSLGEYFFFFKAGNRNLVGWSVVSYRHRHEFHYSRILKCCTRLCTTSNSQTVRAKCDIMWLRVIATQSSPTISPSSIKNKQINTIDWHILRSRDRAS